MVEWQAQSRGTMWVPVVFDFGEEIDGVRHSHAHLGAPSLDKREAWAIARQMCERIDGIGFSARRLDAVAQWMNTTLTME